MRELFMVEEGRICGLARGCSETPLEREIVYIAMWVGQYGK